MVLPHTSAHRTTLAAVRALAAALLFFRQMVAKVGLLSKRMAAEGVTPGIPIPIAWQIVTVLAVVAVAARYLFLPLRPASASLAVRAEQL